MKIIQAIPRRMRFEARASSSVELCVSEWVSGSRYRAETTIFAERSDAPPLLDIDIFRLEPAKRLSSWHLGLSIRRQVRAKGYDLIVTQQHIATAARIAMFNPKTPVVLQTHNFIESPRSGRGAVIANAIVRRRLQSLGGITLISEATRARFEKDWPDVTIPRTVITNGFDFSTWRTDAEREKLVIVVGRARDAKGILESAEGVAAFLATAPDWKAVFILSELTLEPDYVEAVRRTLAPLGTRCEILSGIPFAKVKAITETASICVVASKWDEPFGRTALEAHAARVALISSGTGGLREISGDAALYLDKVEGKAVATALARLAGDEELRERLALAGADRVRSLFQLSGPVRGGTAPLCARLDDFYETVLRGKQG